MMRPDFYLAWRIGGACRPWRHSAADEARIAACRALAMDKAPTWTVLLAARAAAYQVFLGGAIASGLGFLPVIFLVAFLSGRNYVALSTVTIMFVSMLSASVIYAFIQRLREWGERRRMPVTIGPASGPGSSSPSRGLVSGLADLLVGGFLAVSFAVIAVIFR
jgi:hypothetical protein